jgi:hypothetical protein
MINIDFNMMEGKMGPNTTFSSLDNLDSNSYIIYKGEVD